MKLTMHHNSVLIPIRKPEDTILSYFVCNKESKQDEFDKIHQKLIDPKNSKKIDSQSI